MWFDVNDETILHNYDVRWFNIAWLWNLRESLDEKQKDDRWEELPSSRLFLFLSSSSPFTLVFSSWVVLSWWTTNSVCPLSLWIDILLHRTPPAVIYCIVILNVNRADCGENYCVCVRPGYITQLPLNWVTRTTGWNCVWPLY
jgi:hypothetical protein